jgi:hypothetical protein
MGAAGSSLDRSSDLPYCLALAGWLVAELGQVHTGCEHVRIAPWQLVDLQFGYLDVDGQWLLSLREGC